MPNQRLDASTRWKAGLLALLMAPCLAWGRLPTFAIFGQPYEKPADWPVDEPWEPPPTIGVPLTCANANSAIQQWNSGTRPGMQSGYLGNFSDWTGPYEPPEPLPYERIQMMGEGAPYVLPEHVDPAWASPPAGSAWVYDWFFADGIPDTPLPAEPTDIAYMVAIWIPTAEDAARMRVTMTYRAEDQLIAVVRNQWSNPNLLPAPLTADTSSKGTAPGVVQLNSGWQQGANHVTFVVRNTLGAGETQNYAGFAASFSAHCWSPQPVTAVPTLELPALATLSLSLLALGGYARRRRQNAAKSTEG